MNHIKIVNDLVRAKVLFQQRAIQAHLGQMPTGSNADDKRDQCATEGCGGRGVISKFRWDTCVSRETKAALGVGERTGTEEA